MVQRLGKHQGANCCDNGKTSIDHDRKMNPNSTLQVNAMVMVELVGRVLTNESLANVPMIAPILATIEQIPIPVFRTLVGNNSFA